MGIPKIMNILIGGGGGGGGAYSTYNSMIIHFLNVNLTKIFDVWYGYFMVVSIDIQTSVNL